MIRCGWCGRATTPDTCSSCGRDPVLPWAQRDLQPPVVDFHRERLAQATAELRSQGVTPTVERLAEALDVSPRTVRRWQQMAAGRPRHVTP